MLPTIDEIKELEKNTLKVISEINEFYHYPELSNHALNYRNIFNQKDIDIYFKLAMNIGLRANVHRSGATNNLYMGLFASSKGTHPDLSNSSYSLVICECDKKKSKIIRKLHFDYENEILIHKSSEKKPSNHLQICGKLSRYLKELGYDDADLEVLAPGFEKPRMPFMPMCLAILINWVMLEFNNDNNAKAIIRNPRWRKHVAEVERKVLLPYINECLSFFNAAANNDQSFYTSKIYLMP